jgi:hypothetical protein
MADDALIVDSAMDFDSAVAGTSAPQELLKTLRLIAVRYRGFDGRLHQGQLVVHRDLAAEIGEIFSLIQRWGFPLGRAVPIVQYGWCDEASMAEDNASAFNYRLVEGTRRLSRHATGRAIEINTLRIPVFYPDAASPRRALYRPATGVLDEGIRCCAPSWSGVGDGGTSTTFGFHNLEKPPR